MSPPRRHASLSIARLAERVSYDAQTGLFAWRTGWATGKRAGSRVTAGYWRFLIDGQAIYAHRAAWALTFSEWPEVLDHVNGVRDDNRIANLRLATHQLNNENRRAAAPTNKLGVMGVRKGRRGFRAVICHAGRYISLGSFPTVESAHSAYLAKKREIHKGNTL